MSTMYFYSTSPLSLGYWRALVPTILDDESSSALTFGEPGHSALSHTFPPLLDADRGDSELSDSERPVAKKRRLIHHDFGSTRRPILSANDVTNLDDLWKLFSGANFQPRGPLQLPGLSAPRSAESQLSEKHDAADDVLNAVLEFFHGHSAHANDMASASGAIPEPSPFPQVQAGPAVEKGKGKAKAERAEPSARPALQTLLGVPSQRPSDQELKDIELAIKLSLEGRDAADAKKASTSKAVRSSAGASSSRVKLDCGVPQSTTPSSASDSTSVTPKPVPSPVPQPVSPLTNCTVHNHISTLESTRMFPALWPQVTDVEVKGYDVEAEELEALATQEAATVKATLVVEGAGPSGLQPSVAVSQDDADIDLAISEEYLSSPPDVEFPKSTFAVLCTNAAAQTAEGASSSDGSRTCFGDSAATITATPAS